MFSYAHWQISRLSQWVKRPCRGWGGGLMGKVLTAPTWRPELRPHKNGEWGGQSACGSSFGRWWQGFLVQVNVQHQPRQWELWGLVEVLCLKQWEIGEYPDIPHSGVFTCIHMERCPCIPMHKAMHTYMYILCTHIRKWKERTCYRGYCRYRWCVLL